MPETHALVEHFFRHESGRLVALLTRSLGVGRIDLVEDVVQAALLRALQTWSRGGVPDDPAGWLYRTSRNLAVDHLRRERTGSRILPRVAAVEDESPPAIEPGFAEEIGDEPLRLLFVCCHESIPTESRVALALKTLGGFSTTEVARALLTTEANAQKRIARAKERLRELGDGWDALRVDDLRGRLEAVLAVLYLMFNEGYSASHSDVPIRRDLCGEAMRLTRMLASHPLGDSPETDALLAVFCFHAGRFDARLDAGGELVLMEAQDRSRWDWSLIREGMSRMERSARGEFVSRYHVEAAIAWEHARSADFASTDWSRIVEMYDVLDRIAPSAIHTLNGAVARSYRDGPQAALLHLARVPADQVPERYPAWHAVTGELHYRAGDPVKASRCWQLALAGPIGRADEALIRKRLADCRPDPV